jgi:hypothetical protein
LSIRAVKIASKILKQDIWLILDKSFVPDDKLARYFAEEIPLLKIKEPKELVDINKVKLQFIGSRITDPRYRAREQRGKK